MYEIVSNGGLVVATTDREVIAFDIAAVLTVTAFADGFSDITYSVRKDGEVIVSQTYPAARQYLRNLVG